MEKRLGGESLVLTAVLRAGRAESPLDDRAVVDVLLRAEAGTWSIEAVAEGFSPATLRTSADCRVKVPHVGLDARRMALGRHRCGGGCVCRLIAGLGAARGDGRATTPSSSV
jgi:hypothetical protein